MDWKRVESIYSRYNTKFKQQIWYCKVSHSLGDTKEVSLAHVCNLNSEKLFEYLAKNQEQLTEELITVIQTHCKKFNVEIPAAVLHIQKKRSTNHDTIMEELQELRTNYDLMTNSWTETILLNESMKAELVTLRTDVTNFMGMVNKLHSENALLLENNADLTKKLEMQSRSMKDTVNYTVSVLDKMQEIMEGCSGVADIIGKGVQLFNERKSEFLNDIKDNQAFFILITDPPVIQEDDVGINF